MFKNKATVVLLLLLLCGCNTQKHIACNYIEDDKEVYLDIDAIDDSIYSIKSKTCFRIPNSVLLNDNYLDDLKKQLDNSHYFEEGSLIKEEELFLDDSYSLQKTIDYLNKKRFYCE